VGSIEFHVTRELPSAECGSRFGGGGGLCSVTRLIAEQPFILQFQMGPNKVWPGKQVRICLFYNMTVRVFVSVHKGRHS
jgi:hypothetical protein